MLSIKYEKNLESKESKWQSDIHFLNSAHYPSFRHPNPAPSYLASYVLLSIFVTLTFNVVFRVTVTLAPTQWEIVSANLRHQIYRMALRSSLKFPEKSSALCLNVSTNLPGSGDNWFKASASHARCANKAWTMDCKHGLEGLICTRLTAVTVIS